MLPYASVCQNMQKYASAIQTYAKLYFCMLCYARGYLCASFGDGYKISRTSPTLLRHSTDSSIKKTEPLHTDRAKENHLAKAKVVRNRLFQAAIIVGTVVGKYF